MKTPRRSGPLLALACVTAVALVGCTEQDVNLAVEPVAVEVVDVPDDMRYMEDIVMLGGEMLPSAGGLPFAIGGAVVPPGAASEPTVWTSEDGGEWQATVVDEVAGSFTGDLAGSAERAALGGVLWNEGRLTSVLWTSADRKDWERVKLPERFDGEVLTTVVAVVDDTTYLVGTDTEHATSVISVTEEDVTELAAPTTDRERLSAFELAGNDDTLVLIAMPGNGGEYEPIVAFTSTDGAKTWSDAHPLAESGSGVSGITWTGSEFVATGYISAGALYTVAAWSSPDGQTWTAEPLPDFDMEWSAGDADTWLGTPASRDGIVSVGASNDNQASMGAFVRDDAGRWSFLGKTGQLSAAGIGGWVVPDETQFVGITSAAGQVTTGILAGTWQQTAQLAERQDMHRPSEATQTENGALLTLWRDTFSLGEDEAWRSAHDTVMARFEEQTLTFLPSEPERLDSLLSIVRSAGDTGEIVLGSYYPEDSSTITAEGFFRETAEDEWAPVTGFSAEGATNFNKASRVGEQWIAVGTYRPGADAGTAANATAWASPDGLTWAEHTVQTRDGDTGSSMVAVCELADGTPISVGWSQASAGAFTPAAWTLHDTTWQRLDLGALETSRGWLNTCANDGEGVVVSGNSSGRDLLLHSSDGNNWATVFEAKDGVILMDPVSVEGGFAAAGSRTVGDTSTPVVWLSADGENWNPVVVPSLRTGATTMVTPVGPDLLVHLDATVGHPLMLVRDVDKVIKSASN